MTVMNIVKPAALVLMLAAPAAAQSRVPGPVNNQGSVTSSLTFKSPTSIVSAKRSSKIACASAIESTYT